MRRLIRMAAIGIVFALGTGLAIPASVQAGVGEGDAAKITELIKLQVAVQRGEHEMMHQIIDALLAKYPNDPDIKAMDEFHEKWHSRAKLQEELQERMEMYIEAAEED